MVEKQTMDSPHQIRADSLLRPLWEIVIRFAQPVEAHMYNEVVFEKYDPVRLSASIPEMQLSAAIHGLLSVLKWMNSMGYEPKQDDFVGAACSGKLGVLKWARNYFGPSVQAARRSHGQNREMISINRSELAVTKSRAGLSRVGPQVSASLFDTAVFGYNSAYICDTALENNKLDVLRWMRAHGCYLPSNSFEVAARHGHTTLLLWLHSVWPTQPYPARGDVCEQAARNGHFSTLQAAYKLGFHLPSDLCDFAAARGNIEMLMWARTNGCRWNEETCDNACGSGNLSLAKYLVEHGCPWNSVSCLRTALQWGCDVIAEWIAKRTQEEPNGRSCERKFARKHAARELIKNKALQAARRRREDC